MWEQVKEAIPRLAEYWAEEKARLKARVGLTAYEVLEADLTPPKGVDPEAFLRERLEALEAAHPYAAWVEVRGRWRGVDRPILLAVGKTETERVEEDKKAALLEVAHYRVLPF